MRRFPEVFAMSNAGNKTTDHEHHHHSLHEVVDVLKHRMHDAGHKLSDAGHKMSDAVLHQHIALCTACHVELAPEDIAQGYCSDKEACSCRAFSARCW